MLKGKGALVWRLRDWKGGDPDAQVEDAFRMGLDWVSIKMLNGILERWEGAYPNQNADLLPVLVPKLKAANIVVSGWDYLYFRVGTNGYILAPTEGLNAAKVCAKYGVTEWLLDGEREVSNLIDPQAQAKAYASAFRANAPTVNVYLCSYRFPVYHQTFPFKELLAICAGHAPQVYFEQIVTDFGAVNQMLESQKELTAIANLPFIPILPGYRAKYPDGSPWWATPIQLAACFKKAKDLGMPACGLYALDEANPDQLLAWKNLTWGVAPPPPPAPTMQDWAKGIDSWARNQPAGYNGPQVPA